MGRISPREVGNPQSSEVLRQLRGRQIQYRLDRLDDPVIPRKGQALQADFQWTNSSPLAGGAYPSLEVASQNFFKLSEPSSVFLNGFAGTTCLISTTLACRSFRWDGSRVQYRSIGSTTP